MSDARISIRGDSHEEQLQVEISRGLEFSSTFRLTYAEAKVLRNLLSKGLGRKSKQAIAGKWPFKFRSHESCEQ